MTAPLTKWGALSGKFAAIALTLVLMGSQSHAQGTAATFRSLAGSWSGEGTIRMSSGSTERIRCRATYTVGAGDPGGVSQQTMLQELLCASDSFKFQIKTRVSRTDKRLTGNWIELSRNVSGNLVGRITNGRVDATVDGGVFSAAISITPNGRRQAVTIRPSSVDVAEVTIAPHQIGRLTFRPARSRPAGAEPASELAQKHDGGPQDQEVRHQRGQHREGTEPAEQPERRQV